MLNVGRFTAKETPLILAALSTVLLFVYGKDPKPLLGAKLAKSAGSGIKPLAVEVKEIGAETGTLTLFDTDQASFKVAHQP